MANIAIGNLIDPDETAWLYLNEGPLPPGILGTRYEPVTASEATVTETLLISLRGSVAELRGVISHLEILCRQIWLYELEGLGAPIYLRVIPPDNYDPLYSRLLHSELHTPPGALASEEHGSLTLELIITRQNAFDGIEQPLMLSNSAGSGLTAALKNRDDNLAVGNDNYFFVYTDALGTDLPAPMRLQVTNAGSSPLAKLLVGAYHHPNRPDKPPLVLEGEHADEGVEVPAADASNGAYAQFTLTRGAWQALASWQLTHTMLEAFDGRLYLPILRCYNPFSSGVLQFRVALSFPGLPPALGTTLYQSPAVNAVEDQGYLLLAPLRLPFGMRLLDVQPAPLRFTLQGYAPGSGSLTLNIDDILLLPLDDFVEFSSSVGLPAGASLIDDAFMQKTFTLANYKEMRTHQRLGDYFTLPPGETSWFFFFQVNTQGLAPIDLPISVQAWYRQRRQIL
ncbi:MAG: hypothetical protein XD74_1483 [Actinobacteria bacterium 66_15]|nr:MAG: hypothetical protein XD74_1483 [Actinobacteria bacterium 66_15]